MGGFSSQYLNKLDAITHIADFKLLPENNISIGYKVIEKAQSNKNVDHNLSQKTISKVWEALKNPIAVIKAEQNKNETEASITDSVDMAKVINKYCKQYCAHKFDNLDNRD